MADSGILASITGEYFQPVRLHYRVFDDAGLIRAFKKLRCVQKDPTRPRLVWLYDHEARSLSFQRSYKQIPKHLRPIIIGSIFLPAPDKMLLDLRSQERATLAIEFFDRHLPRSLAKVTEAEVVNKLFSATHENLTLTPDSLFDQQSSTFRDPETALRQLAERIAPVQDPEEKVRMALEGMDAHAKQHLPDIERLPIHYYEDGLQGFATALRLRQIIAMQHWSGNTEYTMYDVMQSILKPK